MKWLTSYPKFHILLFEPILKESIKLTSSYLIEHILYLKNLF